MKVTMQLPTASQLIRSKGLSGDGNLQKFHTQNVLRRIKRYMPFKSGATYKITVAQTDISVPEIVTDVPYGQFLYHGKVMIDPRINAAGFMTPEGWRSRKGSIKVVTGRDLEYTRTKNPQAGPYWDKALVAREGKALVADLQAFIDRRSGK